METGKDIERLVSKEELWSHVKTLNSLFRVSGLEDDFKAVDYVVSKLKEYGVDHEVLKFQSYVSHPKKATITAWLDCGEEKSYQCKTRAFSAVTPPEGLKAEIVYVPTSIPGTGIIGAISGGRVADADYDGYDVTNKIVLTQRGGPDGIADAQKHGAAGVIQMWPVEEPVLHDMIVSPVWGTPTLEDMRDLIHIPVVQISHNNGVELMRSCEKGKTECVLTTDVDTQWRELRLPVATIRGNGDDADRYLLIGGHLDSWYEGITDNATGNAALLELARVFKLASGSLNRSVKIAWWCGHSYARYSGSTYFNDFYWADLHKNCVGYINIDSPGVLNAVDYSKMTAMAGLEELVKEPVKHFTGTDPRIERPERCADLSFNGGGIAAMYLLMGNLPPEEAFPSGGSAGGWWWHSEADTIDKADPERLALDTNIYAASAWRMLREPIVPIKLTPIVQDVIDRLKEYDAALKGRFDLEPVKRKADALLEKVRMFEKNIDSMDKGRANTLILKVSKELNQVLYTRTGKYSQDRAVPTPLLPGMYHSFALDHYENSTKYEFIRTGLLRERNRLYDSLDICEEALDSPM